MPTVSERFTSLLSNISLTEDQKTKGAERRESVVQKMNSKYYSSSSSTNNSKYVGSWGKATRIRPPRDVDVLYEMPKEVYDRYQLRTGNKQSQLLQEIKDYLKTHYPTTAIRGDGPVVIVPFQSYNVELIPAFKLTNGRYWVCMTDNGGRYKEADYDAEITHISTSNTKTNNNTRDLIRMVKCWQGYCSVPIKSFWLELLSVKFLEQWANAGKGATYYDWMVRDFFDYMKSQKNTYLYAPGTFESMFIGEAWVSRAESAYTRAKKACEHEANNEPYSAGDEWQKIFGTDIPK